MLRTRIFAALLIAAGLGLGACSQGGGNGAANNAAPAANEATAPETGNMSSPPATNGPAPATNLSGGAPTGGTCGGVAGVQCASAQDFCQHPPGQCNMPDGQGTCVRRPDICPEIHQPVCGCDNRTYGNACEAARAGVSVQAPGACRG